MYLLDTDTLSDLIKPRPSAALSVKVMTVPLAQQFTSSVTLGELFYGAYRLQNGRARLLRRIEETLLLNRSILPFDSTAARRYGEIRAHLERQGTPIGDSDLKIAATALVHELIVVTGNVRHFQRVPNLTVENWLL
jgi:tRNA(fMet)-specific endonuclease VapC